MATIASREDPKYHNLTHYLKLLKSNDKINIIKMLATIGLEMLLNDDIECNLGNIKRYFESSNRFLSNYRQKQQQISIKKHYQHSLNHPKRYSRTDVISHFPFMDEFGGVDEVFHQRLEKVSALSLDEINLRHYIEKIFNEFKIGPKGMKSSDIPSALDILNLPSHRHPHSSNWKDMKTIPFTQWDQIVRSIIDSLRCSVTSVEEDVEKSQKHRRQEKKRPVSAPPRNRNIAMNNQIEGQNLIADLNQNNESAKQEVEKILNDWNDDSVSTDGSPESTTPMKMISSTNNNAKARSHRAEILADKRHWKKTHSKEDNSALSSIASFRLRQYIERPFTPSNESIGFQSKPSQTVPMKKVSPKDSKILSSGSSSLDIADAFLQSTLGKDLTQNYYPVYSEIVEETEKLEKNVESQPNKKPNDEFYQSYYSQNWKSKKGGWVGDFGPHHTHPLSARNSNDDNENGIRKKF